MRTVRRRGIAASPGIAIGTARVVDRQKIKIPKMRLSAEDIEPEVNRLMTAIDESRRQLESAKTAIFNTREPHRDHSLILEAHLLMLEDELLVKGTVSLIGDELINAEWALVQKIDEIKQILADLGDDYFKERAQDVDFVGNRVLRNLLGHVTEIIDAQGEPCIIIAENLSPVETTQLIETPVLGFATEVGTRTSHTAIMAQALGIPAVVGVERLAERIKAGDTVIVDGSHGEVIIRPDDETIDDYSSQATAYEELEKRLYASREEPAVTTDGVELSLLANIEFPGEAVMAIDYGAEGIGLYRTEFLYLDRRELPTEEEQCRIYNTVIKTLAPRTVVFRTFDLGADKLPTQAGGRNAESALGLRAIRFGLKNRTIFKTQLKALLRGARDATLHIMFPMISGVGELRQVKSLLNQAAQELGDEVPSEVRVGCMIELPSAIFVADMLAKEVDFFSIGTNDLIQYSLAIDRGNDSVAYLYTPFHPSVLRAIDTTIKAANHANIPVSMCGGMASEPLLVPLLVGLGLRTLSMAPGSIPMVRSIIRHISSEEAEALTRQSLEMATATEIERLISDYMDQKVGLDFQLL